MYLECSIIICIFLQHMDPVSEINVYIYYTYEEIDDTIMFIIVKLMHDKY